MKRHALATTLALLTSLGALATAPLSNASPAVHAQAGAAACVAPAAPRHGDAAAGTAGSTEKRAHQVPANLTRLAAHNDVDVALLRGSIRTGELDFTSCGDAYFTDPGVPASATRNERPARRASATELTVPLADTFTLESKPGASKLVYLDFNGHSVSGSQWNDDWNGGQTINAAPWSADGAADANFSENELKQIQAAWNVMAEDYAPFDVNVTTREPSADALNRIDSGDTSYGLRVVFTNNGPIGSQCGCGGVALLGVYDLSGIERTRTQPAWVFGNALQQNGKFMGDAASHEVGHTLGLLHDGQRSAAYYRGSEPWGPIMGAANDQPVVQWSKGEYPGADQKQNDTDVIATKLPLRTDEHGDTTAAATAVTSDAYTRGVIATSTDVDVFSFRGSGPYVLDVKNAPASNLDVSMTLMDETGNVVSTTNPAVAWAGSAHATGLDAHTVVDLGDVERTYFVAVDGVGSGAPTTEGKYSDYGSLGAYQFNARPATADEPLPLTGFKNGDLTATASTAMTGTTPARATGGKAPYAFTATGLPAGIEINPTNGEVHGTTNDAGTFAVTVFIVDANGQQVAVKATFTVSPATIGGAVTNNKTVGVQRTKALSLRLVSTGATGTKVWSSSELPAWATLTTAGALKGTPPANGTYTIPATVTVTTKAGVVTSDTATITVEVTEPKVKFSFGTVRILSGVVGQPYTLKVGIRGGYPNYAFQVGGYLPFGTTWSQTDPYSITISGTPTTAGTFGFYVLSEDGTRAQAVKNMKVTIKPPAA